MDRIIFSDLPMKQELHKMHYKVDGNQTIQYEGEVAFPVNSVLAKVMQSGDNVKVVLLAKDDIEGNSAVNAGLFQKELNDINRNVGANIEYITIATPFVETREVHERLFRDMIGKLKDGAHIIGDVTYGPKPLPIIMFMVMNFAEKYFGCEIENIVYGKVDFPNDKSTPKNPVIFDLTPLYYLNSLTNSLDYNSSEEAVKALDAILSL